MKKLLMLLMFSILVISLGGMISLASAEIDFIGSVTQGQCIDLTQEYSNSTYSNVTSVTYPNNSVAYVNYAMTKNGPSYTYSFCDTLQLGDYSYCTLTDVDGVDTSVCIPFQSTTTGNGNSNLWIPIFLLVSWFLLFILAIWQKNEYIGIISGMLLMMASVYIIIYGFGTLADMYTRTLGFVALGIGMFIFFAAMGAMLDHDGAKSSEEMGDSEE